MRGSRREEESERPKGVENHYDSRPPCITCSRSHEQRLQYAKCQALYPARGPFASLLIHSPARSRDLINLLWR